MSEEKKILCPLFSIANQPGDWIECLGEKCAWYYDRQCVLIKIADELEMLRRTKEDEVYHEEEDLE
jgi:hypothetical protein